MTTMSNSDVAQAQTIADTTGGWSQTVDFSQFEPSLGSLLNVNIGLTGAVSGSLAIENLEAASAVFDGWLAGTVDVLGPAGSSLAKSVLVEATPLAFTSETLAAYDGTLDHAGASGATLGGLGNSATQAAVLQPGSVGVDPFLGSGTIALPVTASTSLFVAGPANMQIEAHASAGGTVTLAYNYAAPDAGSQSDNRGGIAGEFDVSLDVNNISYLPTTQPQTLTVADSTTGWTTSVAAQRFDPSLGKLVAVNLTVSNDLRASVAAVNLGPLAGALATTQTADVTLLAPGITLQSNASTGSDANLAAYDGNDSFSGPSGAIEQGLTAGPDFGADSQTDYADLNAYIGSGTIDLPLVSSSDATVTGPGDLLAQLLAQSGATVTISYTYAPPPVLANPGSAVRFLPGTTVVVAAGITASDPGDGSLTGASVTISGGLQPGDVLSAATAGTGITASYSAGTLTLSGNAWDSTYQQVLDSVTYSSTSADPTAGGRDTARTLSWSVTDDAGQSAVPATSTIDVQMPATFVSTADEDVIITQPGTYTIASAQLVHSVVLDSPGATLVLDASLDVAAGFTLVAGTLTFNGGTLSVPDYEQTGGVVNGNAVDIESAATISIDGGTIAATVGAVLIDTNGSGIGGIAVPGGGLVVSAGTGAVTFGAPSSPGSLTATGPTTLDGNVTSSGSQTSSGPFTLSNAATLTTTAVDFVSEDDGGATTNGNAQIIVVPTSPLPTGGVVVDGTVQISQGASQTTIGQSGQSAAINWQSFDVGSHAQVYYQQPNAGGAALNPVPGVSAAVLMPTFLPPAPAVMTTTAYSGPRTAEALGLNASALAVAAGYGPLAPDVWQMMTQADIAGPGSVLDVLRNPAVNAWVAMTVPTGAALASGMIVGGGPMATLSAFLNVEHGQAGQNVAPGGL